MARLFTFIFFVLLASHCFTSLPLAGQEPADEDKVAEKLVKQMAEFLGSKQRYECAISSVVEMVAPGMQNKMETKSILRIERPAKFAVHMESGLNGVNMFSDGQTLSVHMPMLQRYTQGQAPATVAEAFEGPAAQASMMAGPLGSLIPYGGESFYENIMEGVTKSSYLGEAELDGATCHHCRFEQDQFSWDLWIQAGEQPLPRKISLDMSKQLAAASPMLKDAKIDYFVTFDGWDFEPKFDETSFRFDEPDDAEKVDDLFAGLLGDEMSEGPHPLIGQTAPVFAAKNLDDQKIDLEDHFGTEIVILDFWATWCGPCVKALPLIAEVAAEFKDRNVQFFAVNVGEEPKEIREFLTKMELDIPVLLDSDASISDQFQADAIPQTVIVGRQGDIQVVHVGFSGNLKEQLSSELNRLLDGEDLAAETLAAHEQATQQATADDFGTVSKWTFESRCDAIAVDGDSAQVMAASPSGTVSRLNADGTEVGTIEIEQGGKIRIANLIKGGEPELLVFDQWGQSVQAYTISGEQLWDFTQGQGVDDVWAADLDGDGSDEVIVGYNGSTGLYVLDQRGTQLWKYTNIGNVWHVTAGDVTGDEMQEVITTSAAGKIHIFNPDGSQKQDIDLPIYASMVRVTAAMEERRSQILAVGRGDGSETLVSINASGDIAFELALPSAGVDHVDEMIVAKSEPWAAIAMRGGVIHVVDYESGQIIATVSGQGLTSDVAWLPRESNSPLLLIATGRAVNAFEIVTGESTD